MTAQEVTKLGGQSGIKPKIEQINLAKAAALLETVDDDRIRNVRPRMVEKYARDMLAGNWFENGSTLVINELNRMIDGNHRMRALRMAATEGAAPYPAQPGISVSFLVVRGVKADVMVEDTIDTGRPRKYSDLLAIRGMSNATILASVVTRLLSWEVGQYYASAGKPGGRSASFSEMDEFFSKREERILSAVAFGRSHHRDMHLSPTNAGVAYDILHSKDTEKADEFLDRLVTGTHLTSASPIHALRDRLEKMDWDQGKDKNSGPNQAKRLAITIIAWNHWRAGSSPDRLQLPRGGLTNKNFPVPK